LRCEPASSPDGNIWFYSGTRAATVVGRITPAGVYLPTFPVPGVTTRDTDLRSSRWMQIIRMTPTGATTSFPSPQRLVPEPEANTMVPGPDGSVWFTTVFPSGIGFITPDGAVTMFQLEDIDQPLALTAGPDCSVWFTSGFGFVNRITP
jgi:streptogramin lyase